MTNRDFKKIKTDMFSFSKNFHFVSDRLIGVTINGIEYGTLKSNGKLTRNQLQEFEFLDDFENKKGISL